MGAIPDFDVSIGSRVHIDYRKWIDGNAGTSEAHWQGDATLLGSDQYGLWLAMPAGTVLTKPTYQLTLSTNHVKLITDSGWSADICRRVDTPAKGQRQAVIYADMIHTPVWSRDANTVVVTMVDLDHDVIAWTDGTVVIDDEPEFAEHQRDRNYPAEAVARTESACAEVYRLVVAGGEPFKEVSERWLAELDGGT